MSDTLLQRAYNYISSQIAADKIRDKELYALYGKDSEMGLAIAVRDFSSNQLLKEIKERLDKVEEETKEQPGKLDPVTDTERLDFFDMNQPMFFNLGRVWYIRKDYGAPHIKVGIHVREAIDKARTRL